jgi:PAS domain S-box-containing protein
MTQFFGCSFEELNARGWRNVFYQTDIPSAIERRKRLYAGERTDWEAPLKTHRGATRWVHVSNQPVPSADGVVRRFIGVVQDVTDRKADEEVLRSQALAIEVMQEGIVLSDSDGIIRMTNPAFDRMFRSQPGELTGTKLSELPCDPPLSRHIAAWSDDAAARAGAPFVAELTVRGAEVSNTLIVEAALTPLALRGEKFWLTMLQDATARRQLEREVLEASNREQERIGNDLHDGLGQELTGIALLLRGVANRVERHAPELSSSVEEIALLVNDAIFTTRALARGLSPVTFDRGGIELGLSELSRRLSALFRISVRCESEAQLDLGLPSVNALHLYRIAQEAVTNAAQHGHAREVLVQLKVDGEHGQLRIEDDGSGFNTLDGSKGLGLRIMHYRAQMMAGSLSIESIPERGTVVTCTFPRGHAG